MNREYAMEVLESVERGVLEPDSSLAKEAFRYLKKLKKTATEVLDRIYKVQFN